MKKYGFFGGSFNPPTIAHERLAEEIADKFKLDKVYFVPVGNYYEKTDLIDENKRLDMLKSIKTDKIDVLDIELNSKKKLLAVDAFELINDNFYSSENYFILGGDNLEKLPNWENATKCLNNNIIAIQRGKNLASIIAGNKLLEENNNKIFEFNANKLYNYSSTEVRKAIKNGNTETLNKMFIFILWRIIYINRRCLRMKLRNTLFNFFANVFYYIVAVPILFVVDKVFFDYKVVGKENVAKVPGGKITISNHIHYLDCTMNGLINLPDYSYFITLESNCNIPIIGALVKLLRGIPIPTKVEEKKKFYQHIAKLLEEGETVHIYPEGEMHLYNQELVGFKKGAFAMAVESNVPIIPTVILTRKPHGIYKYIKTKPLITHVVLEPIYPDLSIANKLERIENLKKEAYYRMQEVLEKADSCYDEKAEII